MGFLGDLAGIALGQGPAGAARVALPARFAPRAAPLDEARTLSLEPMARAEADAVPAAARSAAPEPVTVETVAMPDGARPASPLQPHRPDIADRINVAPLSEPAMARQGPATAQHGSAAPLAQATMPIAGTARRPTSPPGEVAPLSAPPTKPAASTGDAPKPAATPTPAAPLSASARAARAPSPEVPAPTIVQVTIDRIDVRAAAPPSPAPARRTRPQPSVSLSDYLSGQARRG